MNTDIIKYIEEVFRQSNHPDELFDMLDLAIKMEIKELDLYKILIANPALSKDEIIMFTEKLVREYSEYKFSLYMWTGNVFENNMEYNNINNAFYYYQKSSIVSPDNHTPLLAALAMYNYDVNVTINESILQLVNTGVSHVDKKSEVYSALSKHFGKKNNKDLMFKYQKLSSDALKKGN